jgi:hypothetical protein
MKMSYEGGNPNVNKKTIKDIQDQGELVYIARNAFNCGTRREAIKFIYDYDVLVSISKKDPCYLASLEATKRLNEIKGIEKFKLLTNPIFIAIISFVFTFLFILPISMSILDSDLSSEMKLFLLCVFLFPSFTFYPVISILVIVVGFIISGGNPIGQVVFWVSIMGNVVFLRVMSLLVAAGN